MGLRSLLSRIRTAWAGVSLRWPRRTVVAVLGAVVAVLAVSTASVGAYVLTAGTGAVGHDISYPQCGSAYPRTGTFGVVGVNGGKISTANPCLAGQYAWAAALSGGASLYVNTGNTGSTSTFYWPASGARDPALCTDRASSADPGCAYDYGWHGAADSLRIARSAAGSGVTSRPWWLDVELANSWNGTPTANAAALQGAVDQLRGAGIATVGIYSTSYQWGQITGGYTTSTAASYRKAWASAFTPRYPMEREPNWIAGLGTLAQATAHCSTSVTGGPTTLAQYTDGGVDGDVVCGGTATPPSTTTSPTTTRPATTSPTTTRPPTTTAAPTTAAAPTTTAGPTTTSARPTTPSTTSPAAPTPTGPLTPPATTTPPVTTPPVTTPPRTTPPVTTPPPAPTVPGAPTAVAAAPATVRGVTLTWTAPSTTTRADRYVILRGTAPGRESVAGLVLCSTRTCAVTDPAPGPGTRTYYRVVAGTYSGRWSPPSAEVVAVAR